MRGVPSGIVTIGYEGRTLGDFISTLSNHNVDLLLDVRLNAISRKPGFSKKALANGSSATVDELVALAKERRVAVLCVERDHTICHRGELVAVALERAPKLTVTHAG
jgi:uncharacterized protein (DUF488 family)